VYALTIYFKDVNAHHDLQTFKSFWKKQEATFVAAAVEGGFLKKCTRAAATHARVKIQKRSERKKRPFSPRPQRKMIARNIIVDGGVEPRQPRFKKRRPLYLFGNLPGPTEKVNQPETQPSVGQREEIEETLEARFSEHEIENDAQQEVAFPQVVSLSFCALFSFIYDRELYVHQYQRMLLSVYDAN